MHSTSTEAFCDNFFLCIFCSTTPYKDTDPTSAENRIDDIQEIEKLKVLIVASKYTFWFWLNVATVGLVTSQCYLFTALNTTAFLRRLAPYVNLPALSIDNIFISCGAGYILFSRAWYRGRFFPRLAVQVGF